MSSTREQALRDLAILETMEIAGIDPIRGDRPARQIEASPEAPPGCYHCKDGSKECICPAGAVRTLYPGGSAEAARFEEGLLDPMEPLPARDPRMSRADMVNLPQHYARFAIEPIRFICENGLDFMRGNAVKYILRCDAKNGREDLQKARRYLDMFEKWFFEKDPDWWRAGTESGRAGA